MDLKEIEENTDYEYEFSDIFEIKMKKLIFEEKQPKGLRIQKKDIPLQRN